MFRSASLAAGLALAFLVVLAPAAGTATPDVDRKALAWAIDDAVEDELRALTLLAKRPPRKQTAALVVERSLRRLEEVKKTLASQSDLRWAFQTVSWAIAEDRRALESLQENSDDPDDDIRVARLLVGYALARKGQATAALRPSTSSGGSQCADGRDNDGDRLVDARYDAGCASRKDASEGSPLTCSLQYTTRNGVYVVDGGCSGPFAKLEIGAPRGAALDTTPAPVAAKAQACYLSSARRLDCVMGDGVANPRHVVNARFGLEQAPAAARNKVTITMRDFRGRGRSWTLSLKPTTPSPGGEAFNLGSSPVTAVGTFTNGRGGCSVATGFTDSFQFFAPGDGTLTITQPKTGDRVSGPIQPNGSFRLRSPGESYEGRITGNTATATYSYTANGCTETYDASFVLQR